MISKQIRDNIFHFIDMVIMLSQSQVMAFFFRTTKIFNYIAQLLESEGTL